MKKTLAILVAFAIIALVVGIRLTTQDVKAPDALRGPTWTCSLDGIGATLTLCKSAESENYAMYITDIIMQSTTSTAGCTYCEREREPLANRYGFLFPSAAAVPRFVYPTNALFHGTINLQTPLRVPPGKDLCIICTATNLCTMQIIGQVGP